MEKPGETRGSGEDVLHVFHAQPGGQAARLRWRGEGTGRQTQQHPLLKVCLGQSCAHALLSL